VTNEPGLFALLNLSVCAALFVGMLALEEVGWRLGERYRQRTGVDKAANGATEAAVYGLLGLFLAFTFSGAGARFEARHHLVVQEANAIGTAWLRIDVLPAAAQPHMRELFRAYTDARIDRFRRASDSDASGTAITRLVALQQQIWSTAVAAAKESGQMPPFMVLLPALNEMIDITTTREAAGRLHPPIAVFVMVGTLAFIGALFAGYGMAGQPRSRVYTVGFAAVLTMTLFVIIDFEFPRLGFIRVDAADSLLVDVRQSMK
jgi:hypothetical protein